MKWIKQYEDISTRNRAKLIDDKVEELSEYLQEVFDKFHIIQDKRGSDKFSWHIDGESIRVINIPAVVVLSWISPTPSNVRELLKKELDRIRNLVMTRLGSKIIITDGSMYNQSVENWNSYITIRLVR